MNVLRQDRFAIRGAAFWRSKHFVRSFAVLVIAVLVVGFVRPANAAIAFRSASSGNNAAGATSLTINAPANAVAGDVLIASIDMRTTAIGNFTITAPSGWQLIGTMGTSATKNFAYYLVLTSTPPASYTFQLLDGGAAYSTKASGGMIAYSGVDNINPIDVTVAGSYASSATMLAPSVTTVDSNSMIVALYGAMTGTTATQGSGMTERFDDASTGQGATSRTTSAGQDALQVSPGASGQKTMTLASAAEHTARTIALTPAPVVSQVGYRWFANSTTAGTVGSPLATQDTAAIAPNIGQPFRLRMLLGVSEVQLPASSAFKLQYKWQESGACSSTGSYSDVTSSTPIKYYDNSGVSDAAAIVTSGSDPVRSGVTKVTQTYEELNNFTVSTSIPVSQDGMWDFALVLGQRASDTGVYCFRAINANGAVLSTYSQIPSLTVSPRVSSIVGSNNRLYQNANATAPGAPLAATNSVGTLSAAGDQFRVRTGLKIPGYIKEISGGMGHTCAIASDDKGYCWGDDASGQIGDNSTLLDKPTPVAVNEASGPLVGLTLKSISVGSSHSCAIASNDQAYCWGSDTAGQLGNDGTLANQPTPVAVNTSGVLAGKTILSISAGSEHTCVVASDNLAYCWGNDASGGLGDGTVIANQPTPVAVNTSGVLAGKTILSISAGSDHTCAIASDNKAYCWGSDTAGQVGNDTTYNNGGGNPVAVNTAGVLSGKTIRSIAAGGIHTCAIASDNLAYCWGRDTWGQLGDDTAFADQPTPVAVSSSGVLSGKTISQLSTGYGHTCVIASDNLSYCWGLDGSYQLGNNTTAADEPLPVAVNTSGVLSGKSITSIVGGWYHTCAIASDAKAYCWGDDAAGQIGNDASLVNQTSPVIVNFSGGLSGNTVLSVSSGAFHTCAIASDNKAYCWGEDVAGQLGDDASFARKNIPTAVDMTGVLSGKTILSISAGGNHTCAIASDNLAYCWGDDGVGQLGNNVTLASQTTPVAVSMSGVLSGKTILSITTGYNHTCVIASDNKAYCWGEDFSGALGNDTSFTNQPTPVAVNTAGVLSGKNIVSISSKEYHTCAVASDNLAYCWGQDTAGQLGNDSTLANQPTPVAVSTAGVLSGKTILSISAGGYHACVIASDNLAYCWGQDTNGQLGNDTNFTNQPTPVAVSTAVALSGKTILSISAGGYHTCAIASDNQAYCWGNDGQTQLGDYELTPTDQPTPVEVINTTELSGKTILSISGGAYHTCAIASDSRAYCWGDDAYGQLGNDMSISDQSTPVLVRETLIGAPTIQASRLSLHLEYALKSAATCSVQTGYSIVTNATPIAFHDNAGASNGASITLLAADPVASNSATAQAYQDVAGTFTNPAIITKGLTGLWDFSLKDNGAPANSTYCLRLASSDGSSFGTYESFPEITTAAGGGGPADVNAGLLRGGQAVVDGIKQLFSW